MTNIIFKNEDTLEKFKNEFPNAFFGDDKRQSIESYNSDIFDLIEERFTFFYNLSCVDKDKYYTDDSNIIFVNTDEINNQKFKGSGDFQNIYFNTYELIDNESDELSDNEFNTLEKHLEVQLGKIQGLIGSKDVYVYSDDIALFNRKTA